MKCKLKKFVWLPLSLMTACASTSDHLDATYRKFVGELSNVHQYSQVEQQVSYLDSVTLDANGLTEKQKSLLKARATAAKARALALATLGSELFPQHGYAYAKSLRGIPLHTVSVRDQALAALGSIAAGKETMAPISTSVRKTVAELCAPLNGEFIRSIPSDIRRAALFNERINFNRMCAASLANDITRAKRSFITWGTHVDTNAIAVPCSDFKNKESLRRDVLTCAMNRVN